MGFTEKKFASLGRQNKLKKIIFAVREYLDGNEKQEYISDLVQWFNIYENDSLEIPGCRYEWGILINKFLQELGDNSNFSEEIPYDDQGRTRTVIPLKVLLDNIRSPFNVGSILRTSEAMGVEEVILCGITPGLQNKKINRTSKNADIPLRYAEKTEDELIALKSEGIKIIALEKTRNSIPLQKADWTVPCILVLGNEEFGIDDKILNLCDHIVHIPMHGVKNSINVSTAAGIALFHFASQF